MRAPANVRLERLEKILEQLSNESEKGNPIIVEGSKDKNALRAIGITGTILCLQSSRLNPLEFVEELGDLRHAIVLTDFDRQGVSLAHRLSRTLNSRGTLGNIIIWRSLRELTRSNLRSIEELQDTVINFNSRWKTQTTHFRTSSRPVINPERFEDKF